LVNLYEYAHSIKAVVRIYYQVLNPRDSDLHPDEIRVLEQINRIGDDNNDEYLLIFAMFLSQPTAASEARLVSLRLIERALFLGTFVYIPDEDDGLLAYKIALDLMSGKMTLNQLPDIIQKHIDRLLGNITGSRTLSYWASKPLGFYRWAHIKYFMFEYEQRLREHSKATHEKLHWKEFLSESNSRNYETIEHIYPQRVTSEYWKTRFKHYDIRERNALRNSLGNLLPVSRPKNSSLSNKSFPEKKGGANNSIGYAYGCFSENEVACSADWNAIEILERGIKLLAFLEERWGVSIGDRNAKIKALRLEFVSKKEAVRQ